jgi:hypothetical protein
MTDCLKVNEFINYYYSTRLGLFVSDLDRRYIYNIRDVPILVCEYFEAYKNIKGGYWVRKGRKIIYCRRLGVETIKKLRLKTYDLSLTLALLQDVGEYLKRTGRNMMYFDKIDRAHNLYRINRLVTYDGTFACA